MNSLHWGGSCAPDGLVRQEGLEPSTARVRTGFSRPLSYWRAVMATRFERAWSRLKAEFSTC